MKEQVTFEWEKSHIQIIHDKGFGKELNEFIGKTIAEYAYQYVPYDPRHDYGKNGGHLADTFRVIANDEDAKIVYYKKYAAKQYNVPMNHSTSIHPLATDHWVEDAFFNSRPLILSEIDAFRKRLAR